MTRAEIDNLLYKGIFPDATCQRQLIETHISWVILCDRFVYKIKKPIKYSFLDFSTLEKRKYFCERELQLNRRFAENIYLQVMPIYKLGELYKIAVSMECYHGVDTGSIYELLTKARGE